MAAAAGLVISGLAVAPAYASHVPFGTSTFEIDTNANLVVDHTGNLDWAAVTEERTTDIANPKTDNSFGQGTKEDTEIPSVVTGSIPPNKSDLKNFGFYLETTAGGHQYLHLFWHRVQDPTGTTNMDFEFNQSGEDSGNGVTPERTHGDVLIQYDLSNGGVNPQLSVSRWLTAFEASPLNACEAGSLPCWSTKVNFTAQGLATGSINTSAITSGNADGLGSISARTFGEATLDFTALASTLDECATFGSAYLKSRSSDAFTAALKDFIAPIDTNFPTCGGVIIRKQTDPDGATKLFDFTKSFSSDPADASFQLADGESKSFAKVPIGETGTVTETAPTGGWDFDSIDCSASTDGANFQISGRTVTFDLESADDTLDCTYHNKARGTLVVEKVTDDGTGTFGYTSNTLSPASFDLTTVAADTAVSKTFTNLVPGAFDVSEVVPANWHLVSANCDGGSPSGTGTAALTGIDVGPGETVTCTFHNARDVGAIKIVKTRKHAAAGIGGDHPHAGVTFTVFGGELPDAGTTVQTNSEGVACVPGLLVSALLEAGDEYVVHETVPAGYVLDTGDQDQVATVVESDCAENISDADLVAFHNTPLTNITVSVNSQVDGGTFSSVDCEPSAVDPDLPLTSGDGDGSVTLPNLLPGTYVCTVVVDP
ncbi:collagen binding domain-containing protein [Agromyces sp. NPDC058104]|uniref:MSCRAMM family protein n=1 Tax=Agromyces sp. NPDC058104 TaxID=3346342 RepID=UPI0036DC295F